MTQTFCPIRMAWVANLPEERVRQELLRRMIEQSGYPKSLIVVEKGLDQLPHISLKNSFIPNRRADILCFGYVQEKMIPLLLVECKAVPLTPKVVSQVVGYNAHVGARYVAIANQGEVRTGWYDGTKKEYVFVDRLPLYEEMLR